jgi:hypothetical protein
VLNNVRLNTDTGQVINSTLAYVEDAGDYWLVWMSVTDNSSGNNSVKLDLYPATDDYGGNLDDAAVTGSATFRYPQIEAGSFPTSYIPTSGTTVTRAADIASIPTSAFGYNQLQGTIVVEASPPATNVNLGVASLDNGTNNERIQVFAESTGDVRAQLVDGGVLQAAIDTGTTQANQFFKSAAGVKENNSAHSVNGGSVVADTSCTIPTVSTLRLGSLVGANYLSGHIKSIQYYPRRLSNAQLQELTS